MEISAQWQILDYGEPCYTFIETGCNTIAFGINDTWKN